MSYPPLSALSEAQCLEAHDYTRRQIIGDEELTRTAHARHDDPRNIADTFVHETLEAIETAGLRTATLPDQPWAGHFTTMATASGLLGCRYLDLNSQQEWSKAFNYIRNHPASVILQGGLENWIAELAPAEKYDALIGDDNQTLTKSMWAKGQAAFDKYGEVPGWFGICHGWAPAAFMMPRPQHALTLSAPDGTPITFHPADLKALASLLWANASPRVRFVGGRCNIEPPYESDPTTNRITRLFNPFIAAEMPPLDPVEFPDAEPPGWVEVTLGEYQWNEETGESFIDGGRIIAAKCTDTNPATWHLGLVNQLGVSQRSMVMDASFNHEVWNQPLHAYQYTYFNPQTLEQTDDIAAARVAVTDFDDDIFKSYRAAQASSVVGVIMRVTYAIASWDNDPENTIPEWLGEHDDLDTVRRDLQLTRQDYYYDLELDATGKVIGGEWYTRDHPDFLWTPPAGSRAVTRHEATATGEWDSTQPLPESWRVAARAAAREGTPLAALVESMIAAANAQVMG
jgi:hypothetical protein